MLNAKDYKQYIEQIEKIETSMAELYDKCFKGVEDQQLKDAFQHLIADEIQHQNICKELYALLPVSS